MTTRPALSAKHDLFARRLNDAMSRARMSQSDLARAVWGSTEDARGRQPARNRDRISHYARGLQLPEPATLQLLAAALGVEPDYLIPPPPPAPRSELTDERPEMRMTMVAGRSDLAFLEVNKQVPTELAGRIITMLSAVPALTGA